MSVGSRLAELRKSQHLTQAALAKQIGLSASTIAMYETNRRVPDDAALAKLCEALSVGQEALLADQALDIAAPELGARRVNNPGSAHQDDVAVGPLDVDGGSPTVVRETSTPAAAVLDKQQTQLALSRDEARIILFLRMNPMCMPFVESYIRADAKQRDQLAKTWRLIHDFQGQSTF